MHCNEIDAETYSSEDIKEQKKEAESIGKLFRRKKQKRNMMRFYQKIFIS